MPTKPPYLLDPDLPDQRLSDDETPPVYAQEAETVRRVSTRFDGYLPKDDLRRAFVDGAKWWHSEITFATMFGSERHMAEAEAEKRYKADESLVDITKLELNAAFAAALLELAQYSPSGGFVAPSNVRRILIGLAERLGVKLEEVKP